MAGNDNLPTRSSSLFAGTFPWRLVTEFDTRANELADRHYSRQSPGCGQVGGPGRRLVMLTRDGGALWLTHYPRPDLAQDGLDAYRCAIFRRESGLVASALIEAAMDLTERLWGPAPDGWVTWVDTRKVRSSNPGYCFLRAGWRHDPDWQPKRGRRGKLRFLADQVYPERAQLVQLDFVTELVA